MNLRYIVPALGILASTSGALFAENVGGLSIGGYVDTIGQASHTDDGDADLNPDTDGAPVYKHFSSAVELRAGYKVGDQVTAQIDLEWNNGGDRDVYLEQAYINYAVAESFSLTSGKFTTYAGWVAADADGLFRVGAGPIVAAYGGELVGVAGNFAPSEDLGISVFLVNGLDIGDVDTGAGASLTNDDSINDSTNDHMAVAVDVVYKVKDVGTFNLEGGYDMINADDTFLQLGANATIKLASYEALTLGAEVILQLRGRSH